MQCMVHERYDRLCITRRRWRERLGSISATSDLVLPFLFLPNKFKEKKFKEKKIFIFKFMFLFLNLCFWFLTVSPNNSHREAQGTNPCFSFRPFYGSCLRDFHVRVSQSKSFTESHVYKYIDKSHKP